MRANSIAHTAASSLWAYQALQQDYNDRQSICLMAWQSVCVSACLFVCQLSNADTKILDTHETHAFIHYSCLFNLKSKHCGNDDTLAHILYYILHWLMFTTIWMSSAAEVRAAAVLYIPFTFYILSYFFVVIFNEWYLISSLFSTAVITQTGYSFGYAFVDFAAETDSQRAIKSLNGITVRNKRLKVSKNSSLYLFKYV